VRSGQAATRADLAALTGLARSTVAQRVDALLAMQLLVARGDSQSTGGRPPTMLAFNHEAGVVLALGYQRRKESHFRWIRGQIEALFSAPRFVARDASGATVSEKSWPDGTKLGHECALDHLFEFLRGRADGVKLIGVGPRVVPGRLE